MNKSQFFAELTESLQGLSPEERQDILRDMEEHFYEASQRGMSDEAIIEKLGSPKKISETIVAETKVNRISKADTVSQKISAVFAAAVAIIVLTPFNFFFVFIPLLIVTGMLMSFWSFVFALIISLPIVLIATLILMFEIGFKIMALLCLLFLALGWSSMVLAVVLGLVFITVLFFKGIVRVFQWNINIIKNQLRR